jgi:signal transduction histidine kinase
MADTKVEQIDMVRINDVVQSARENWNRPEVLAEQDFGIDYLVLNHQGKVIFQTKENDIQSINDAITHNYPHISVLSGDTVLGEVVILTGPQQQIEMRQKISVTLLGTFAVMLLVMILYGGYVRRNIIKPFENMQKFANEVAAGNLDVSIRREKDNLFGAFTESFDIMREELAAAKIREAILKKKEKELIAQLSHDLKTPITGIKLTSELLKVKVTDVYEREKIENIYQKADQIDALVSDLFASTLDELGQMQVNVRDEDAKVLADIVKRHDDKGLVNQGTIPECMISVDARRMEQIIANVISNSYKYANTKIDITYSIIEGYLQMEIRDYGPGVSEDEIHLVTNKFYRGKSEEISMQDGSGLGLYISRSLMEMMSGEIICSEADPGFRVSLLVPLS